MSRRNRPRVARPVLPSGRAATARPSGVGALDGGVVASSALLAALGVVMIYSTTAPLAMESAFPPHFLRHLTGLGLGLGVVVGATRTPLALWRRLALPLWTAGVLLLALTLVVGVEANGARRWLPLPFVGVSLQPAELAKWTTPVALAALLADARHTSWRPVQVALLLAAVPAGLLLLQPDLGSAALLLALVGIVLFAAALPLRRLAGLAGIVLAVGAVYVAMRPYALARWKGFLAPWQTARNEGFQLVQSFVAFGRGGAFGVGLGDGRQKLSYLPEAHTDFILSVVAEELGLVGVLVVLGAFAAFTMAGLRIAQRATSPFTQLMAVAMTSFVALPAAVNAAVVMGLLPTTGFTLPFLSFGSNSLVMCGLAVGVLLHIAVQQAPRPARFRSRR